MFAILGETSTQICGVVFGGSSKRSTNRTNRLQSSSASFTTVFETFLKESLNNLLMKLLVNWKHNQNSFEQILLGKIQCKFLIGL